MANDFIFGETSFSDYVVKRRQGELRTVWHAQRIEPRDPLPGQPVQVTVEVGTDHRADAVYCYWTTKDEQPYGRAGVAACGQVVALEREGPRWDDLIWSYVERWRGTLPPQVEGTRVRYRLEAWDGQARRSAFADSGDEDPLSGPPFAYVVDRRQPPAWLRDAIVYQIMVDRFYPGNGRAWRQTSDLHKIVGGTLRGVTDKLPYIVELGANTLWISPISEGPSWHHYDTTDHRLVAPHLGTNEDFRTLVREAHAAGFRVILDYIVHATSNEHRFLKAAQADAQSEYCRWYTFTDWPQRYECFFNLPIMPHLNLEHPPARQYIIDTARMWVEDYGVDGLRLDYAIKPSHDFWVALQTALVAARPECATIAEAVGTPEYLRTFEGKLDGGLDFTWAEAARATFATRRMDVRAFERFLSRHEAYAGEGFVRPSFIDNHDMNRILFMAGGDKARVKLAAACQFTLSQPPIVLYGTEVGMSQTVDSRPDLDVVREPMPWGEGQDRELLAFYQRLCALRKGWPALRRGARRTVYLDEETWVYAKGQGGEVCLVALHNGEGRKEVTLDVRGMARAFRDGLADGVWPVRDGKLALTLGPKGAAILVPA